MSVLFFGFDLDFVLQNTISTAAVLMYLASGRRISGSWDFLCIEFVFVLLNTQLTTFFYTSIIIIYHRMGYYYLSSYLMQLL